MKLPENYKSTIKKKNPKQKLGQILRFAVYAEIVEGQHVAAGNSLPQEC